MDPDDVFTKIGEPGGGPSGLRMVIPVPQTQLSDVMETGDLSGGKRPISDDSSDVTEPDKRKRIGRGPRSPPVLTKGIWELADQAIADKMRDIKRTIKNQAKYQKISDRAQAAIKTALKEIKGEIKRMQISYEAEILARQSCADVLASSFPSLPNQSSTVSYAHKLKTANNLPPLKPTPLQQAVQLYPTDHTPTVVTSEDVRKAVKSALNPRTDGVQVKRVRSLANNGLLIETTSAKALQTVIQRSEAVGLRASVTAPNNPRLLLHGVDPDISKADLLTCIFSQNLANSTTEDEFRKGVNPINATKRPDRHTVSWLLEVSPEMRRLLIDLDRVYVDFSACTVRDYAQATRCYRCHWYGHPAKYCREKDPVCGHCTKVGHEYKDCPTKSTAPKCPNCFRLNKDACHDVRDAQCPVYRRAVEAAVKRTNYGL